MENYIFFMHSQPATYFVSRLPLDLVIFQSDPFCLFFSYTHHSPLPPSPVKSAVTHTFLRSTISPSPIPFPLSFFLSFLFDIIKREEGSGNGGEPGSEGRRRDKQ